MLFSKLEMLVELSQFFFFFFEMRWDDATLFICLVHYNNKNLHFKLSFHLSSFHLSNKPNDTSVTVIATLCYLLNINKVVEILWQFVLLYLRERINGQN